MFVIVAFCRFCMVSCFSDSVVFEHRILFLVNFKKQELNLQFLCAIHLMLRLSFPTFKKPFAIL